LLLWLIPCKKSDSLRCRLNLVRFLKNFIPPDQLAVDKNDTGVTDRANYRNDIASVQAVLQIRGKAWFGREQTGRQAGLRGDTQMLGFAADYPHWVA
jgi:hypothetical protein